MMRYVNRSNDMMIKKNVTVIYGIVTIPYHRCYENPNAERLLIIDNIHF